MANGQAVKGGEQGLNGEFYKGGQFLPSSEKTVKGMQNGRKSTGKREIAPYVWDYAPAEDMLSIYDRVKPYCRENRSECEFVKGQGFIGLNLEVVDQEQDMDVITDGCPGVRHVGNGQYEAVYRQMKNRDWYGFLCGLAQRFNDGERWYPLSEDPYYFKNKK